MLKEVNTLFRHYFEDELGRKQGSYTLCHNNRRKSVEGTYVDDKVHGKYKEWRRNGTVSKICFFNNGKKHGEYKSWWENGNLNRHGFYVNDVWHGEYKSWNPDGSPLTHCFVIEGSPVPFSKLPFPVTLEDRMYFMLKYDLQLLPVETIC